MALLTGCRLNQLAQLRVSDVELITSPYLSINAARVRTIPLNETAYKLLTELVYEKECDKRLFEGLPYSQLNGYTGKPSKYFSKLCRESLKFKGVSFYSFQHSAVTHLFNGGVKEELIGQLVGHSIGKRTTGKVYMPEFNDEARNKAMQCLSVIDDAPPLIK